MLCDPPVVTPAPSGLQEAQFTESGWTAIDEQAGWPRGVACGADTADKVASRPRPGPPGKHVKKPDASRHADGTPSAYACGKQYCKGVMRLDPSVELVHGDAATCNECASLRRFCATCNGFYDATRVVCHAVTEGTVFARNGQHPLNHKPRSNRGGRQLVREDAGKSQKRSSTR